MARRNGGPGEFGVIARVFAPLAAHPGAFGLRDDAAVVPRRAGTDLVVTKDAIVEGVHFLPDDPPDLVARKLLRVNVSDLAAKGAKATGYFLAAALPQDGAARYAARFGQGLAKDQKLYGLQLFGGDTVVTAGPVWFSCTMFGAAPRGRMIRRSGAKAGHDLWLTGTIGDSGTGLALWRGTAVGAPADVEWLKSRYRLPEPPAGFGPGLHGIASAALDVSDGLLQDAGHLARESAVALTIDIEMIPLSPQNLRVSGDTLAARCAAVQAGDDYQILFTAPARKRAAIEALGQRHIVRVTRIGAVEAGDGARLIDRRGRIVHLKKRGYTHF